MEIDPEKDEKEEEAKQKKQDLPLSREIQSWDSFKYA